MSEHISKAALEAALNEPFKVSNADLELTLDKVTDGVASREDFECFSLELRGTKDRPLDQGTFELTHERLGTFLLFMTPVEQDENARTYQAVFNRPRRTE